VGFAGMWLPTFPYMDMWLERGRTGGFRKQKREERIGSGSPSGSTAVLTYGEPFCRSLVLGG